MMTKDNDQEAYLPTMGDMSREEFIRLIEDDMMSAKITMGTAVKCLRTEITKLNRAKFAQLCKVSPRVVAYIENDEGNQTIKSVNAVFRPFGLELCPARIDRPKYLS